MHHYKNVSARGRPVRLEIYGGSFTLRQNLNPNTQFKSVSSHACHSEHWRSVRTSYDTIASEYARRLYSELNEKPFDRDWLERFAARLRASGVVCDLGCGPGHVARYLRDRGVDVFGVDLSPAMVEEARRLNSDIEFNEGTMMALDIASESLAGVVALYSIIHLERGELGMAFTEMWRVLRPGGCLFLAFHVGSESIHNTEWWGYSVDLDATFFTSQEVIQQLEHVGFAIEAAAERAPYAEVEYQSRRGYIVASKGVPVALDQLNP